MSNFLGADHFSGGYNIVIAASAARPTPACKADVRPKGASAQPDELRKGYPQSSSDDRPGRVFGTAKLEQIRKGAKGARVWGRSLQHH